MGDSATVGFAALDGDLARRVRRLESIEAAKAVVARYGRACDAKDTEMLRADVFTADVALHIPGRDVVGIDAVTDVYQAAFDREPGVRRHFVVNHIAEVNDGGNDAVAIVELDTYFLFVSQDGDSVIGWGGYRDEISVDGGVARIRDKTIRLDVVTTLGAGWATASA